MSHSLVRLLPSMSRMALCLSLLLGLALRPGAAAADWKAQMETARSACQVYGETKAAGAEPAKLEKSKLATRSAINQVLMGNYALFNTDASFRGAVMPQFEEGGASLDKSSAFIQACFAVELLELRTPWGHFMEALGMEAGCRQQADTTSELEGRCFPSAISNAMDAFQWSGEVEEMNACFTRATAVKNKKGQRLLRWKDPMMHPMITVKGLRNKPVWEKGGDPIIDSIMSVLEENAATFKRELQALKDARRFGPAYDHLVGAGSWDRVSVYTDGDWDEDLCKLTPETCRLLRGKLFGERVLPYIVNNHEEVAFFYASPSSRVLPHSGQQNVRINVHIGLEGFDDSELVVYMGNKTKVLKWSDTSAFAFNDAWQHEVVNGAGHRYVLAVGVMHPDLDEASYAGAFNERTFRGPLEPGSLERFRRAKKAKDAKKAKGEL